MNKKHTEESKKKISENNAKFWLGKKRVVSSEWLETIQRNAKKNRGENNYIWKGDKVGYGGLHKWVSRQLGTPSICKNKDCYYPRKNYDGIVLHAPKRYHWANISKKYLRDTSDWVRLCSSCHHLWDNGTIKIKILKQDKYEKI